MTTIPKGWRVVRMDVVASMNPASFGLTGRTYHAVLEADDGRTVIGRGDTDQRALQDAIERTGADAIESPAPASALDEAQRQQARHLYQMVMDALRHAESLATRASEAMDGTEGALAFAEVQRSLAAHRDTSSALRAVFTMTLPSRDR